MADLVLRYMVRAALLAERVPGDLLQNESRAPA